MAMIQGAAVAALLLGMLALTRGSDARPADPAGLVMERTRVFERSDGTTVVVTALIEAAAPDPEGLMDEMFPLSHRRQADGVTAAFAIWVKWARQDVPVTVYYNPAGEPAGVDGLGALREGMASWNSVPRQYFRFIDGGLTGAAAGDCTSDVPGDGLNTLSWGDLPPRVLGRTCYVSDGRSRVDNQDRIFEGDIVLGKRTRFSTVAVTPQDSYDLRSNVLHELGHLLGLDHTDKEPAVMLPTLSLGLQRRTPTDDDVDGIRALYGDGSPPTTPTPQLTLPVRSHVVGLSRD
ncbi:MAG: matrixin family metalloprotease [Dehalococcoidia bacterium]